MIDSADNLLEPTVHTLQSISRCEQCHQPYLMQAKDSQRQRRPVLSPTGQSICEQCFPLVRARSTERTQQDRCVEHKLLKQLLRQAHERRQQRVDQAEQEYQWQKKTWSKVLFYVGVVLAVLAVLVLVVVINAALQHTLQAGKRGTLMMEMLNLTYCCLGDIHRT